MNRRLNRDRITALIVLAPSVILIAIFVYGFIGWTAWTSTTNSNALQQLSGQSARGIGLRNYTDLFTGVLNERFRVDIVNTIFFTALFIAACLLLGLFMAILLDQKVRGEGVFRAIFLFPMALSFVVTGVVWKWLFNPTSGLNALPTYIGGPQINFRWFISQDKWLQFQWQNFTEIIAIIALGVVIFLALWYWSKRNSRIAAILAAFAMLIIMWITLGNTQELLRLQNAETHGFNVALLAVVVAAVWQMSGYTMAMYLAGLRGIPEELREAARVDGASEIGVYLRIILPLLAPITLSAMIVLGHISLKIFDLVYAIGGGDNLFIDMPGLNMFFTTFRGNEFGRGAAIAMVMLVLVAVVIVPYLVSSLREEVDL